MVPYRFRNIGFYSVLGAMGLGALVLLPGDETARPEIDRIATVGPERPSYLVEVPQTVDAVATASVAPVAAVPAEQEMPAPLTAEPEPVTTATLTVTTPPAGSDEFPMDVAPADEPATDAAAVPAGAERLTVRSAVNMRVGPSTSTSTIMVLPAGEPVAVLGRNRGWINVALADGQTGWVYQRYLSGGAEPEAEPARKARAEPVIERETRTASVERRRERRRIVEVVDDGYSLRRGVALRDRPSRDGAPLFRVEQGEPIEIAERRGNWVRIRVDGGVSGWVRVRDIAN
jgi:SH3-like domain-containing protein